MILFIRQKHNTIGTNDYEGEMPEISVTPKPKVEANSIPSDVEDEVDITPDNLQKFKDANIISEEE